MYSFKPAKHKDCYLVYILIEMAASTCMDLPEYLAQERQVLLLKENIGRKRRYKGEGDHDEGDLDIYLGLKDIKSSKKYKRI
ncbi:hypothetical protein K1719_043901 [Acacia pycnantha]|nr:hypothetical protein K1719_043901 [Acacia pycnantha]